MVVPESLAAVHCAECGRKPRPGELSRFMGTSVEQIDKTYGHLLPDALDRTRRALDAFVGERAAAEASV